MSYLLTFPLLYILSKIFFSPDKRSFYTYSIDLRIEEETKSFNEHSRDALFAKFMAEILMIQNSKTFINVHLHEHSVELKDTIQTLLHTMNFTNFSVE